MAFGVIVSSDRVSRLGAIIHWRQIDAYVRVLVDWATGSRRGCTNDASPVDGRTCECDRTDGPEKQPTNNRTASRKEPMSVRGAFAVTRKALGKRD